MKKEYETPEIGIVQLSGAEDIITTSLDNMGGNKLEGESDWSDFEDEE